MRSVTDIRSTFINFFKQENHEHLPSSPLVPRNDPTLLFTNAGMVQFKDVFIGAEERPYKRAVTSQKCVRAGGKHNDLENVGYTARHHTFFEMLGNFSFGDYFKEQAIYFGWTLATREFGLDKNKILVTVYADDEEAATLWRKIAGLREDRIIRIATSDNFWSMGDTGPCGPCTEMFYDHGEGIPGGPPGSPDEDGDRFIEFWNHVFMQFEQLPDGRRVNLPKPSVDTGMGLERIAAILQGVHNNYDIDLFQDLIQASIELTGAHQLHHRQSHNVIADHLRACSFLLADGVLPSNEGRGYVLRRIMRRAMRHAHLLGAKEPLIYRLVPRLVEVMGGAYPELGRAEAMIRENLKLEEEKFRQTLERGLRLLEEETDKLSSGQSLPGTVAFKLYDTYGFPLDLTQDVLRSQNRTVDLESFDQAMAEQKAAARASWIGSGDIQKDQIWFDLYQTLGATEFLGYEALQAEGIIQTLLNEKLEKVSQVSQGETAYLVINQTPFYAESGGQIGDQGEIHTSQGSLLVHDTVKQANLHVHAATVTQGTVTTNDLAKLAVNGERRAQIRAHHSATHLLHAALRKVLGTHVTQKGSLVAPDRLRFDFTHTKPLTSAELSQIEDCVNRQVLANTTVETHLMKANEAIAKGAMALFGERYGDEVRVLTMGQEASEPFSVELCGGTHVHQTGDIGLFKIISESGVSSGVRRIEALAGLAALSYVSQTEQLLRQAADTLKTPPLDLVNKLTNLITEKRQLERQVSELRQQLALKGSSAVREENIKKIGNVQFISRHLTDVPIKDLKPLVDQLKQQVGSGVIVVTSVLEDKVSLVIGVTNDLTSQFNAVDLVRQAAEILGGKGGGGRPDLAQAGGTQPQNVSQALELLEKSLQQTAASSV
jgi:alanyl-tRNA synthetase